jgi:transposase InsO family protein
MSHSGIPADYASCERFIGTLKRGEIYLKDYDDAEAARRQCHQDVRKIPL